MVQCTQPPPQLKLPESKITELTDDENHDSPPKPEKRTRMHHIERHRSCVVTLSDIELNGLQPSRLLQTIEKSPGGGSQCSLHEETPTDTNASHRHAIADAAWEALKRSIVYFTGQPIGTVAAIDKSQGAALNYNQVFMRDFIPSALAFLMKGEHLIVKNFLVETACLQSREKMVDLFKLGQGVMPASFKVHHRNPTQKTESLLADFGETAIERVAPVDSGLWWIILLRAYTKWTGDNSLAKSPNCQRAMHLILRLCLSEGCDTSPALLCADGCSMIDRRMVFMRYFIPSALAFLMKGEHLIVKNFLVETARLQSREKMVDLFKLGQGLMPAIFKVHHCNPTQKTESLLADFGETAIGRVAPVDSGLWWIILFRAYTKWTGDNSLAESPNCQRAMHLILRLCVSEGCDTSPALLCADGCSMIDRRMVFMRDFIPSALAFLMKGEHLIVKNFLVETAHLQSREKMVDLFKLGQGVMPASFKVHHRNPTQKTESLLADFGETAIGRVAPVDSGLWWIILLRAYTKWTGDNSLAESPNCQRAMHLILRLCLSEGCDISPALLCADGCSMIDRRMGIYDYPIEIQALFFMAMRCALSLFKQDSDANFVDHITKRIQDLSYHLHSYYWLDFQRLNDIYRHKTEEYSQTALNKFNVIPESIPDWIFDLMPSRGGYFIGNVSPARMDFRWFCLGNFIAILSSLATGEQAEAILDLVEERWQELIGEMPLKICYPAMENREWQLAIGYDQDNTRWSCHNGGSQPDHSSRTEECESADFSKILRIMRGLISIEKEPSNSAFISLDGLDRFLETYLSAIGQLRRYCEVYGIRKDLSDIGRNLVVFTTPPQGVFYFNVEYRGRVLKVVLNVRDLYLMGWSGVNGRFEMKMCKRKNYMSNPVTVLPFKKNYRFLAPRNERGVSGVQNVLIGLSAWQLGFEATHKSTCENKGLRTFAVHLAEAARIQSVFKDICVISAESAMETLDSRSMYNSFWISNYGHYAGQEMRRIDTLSSGEVPEQIKDCSTTKDLEIKISESEILSQLRILPRDVYRKGVFKCLEPSLNSSETDMVLESPKPNDRSSEGWKSPPKGRGGGDGGSSSTGGAVGGGGSPALYLLEDWGQPQEEKEPPSTKASENMLWVEDFLDHFPSVRRFITLQRKEPTPPAPTPPPPAVTRTPAAVKLLAPQAIIRIPSAVQLLATRVITRTAAVKVLSPPAIRRNPVVKLMNQLLKPTVSWVVVTTP